MATSNYPGPTVAGVRAAMRDPKRPSESTPTVADVREAANDPKRPSEFPTKREKRQEKKAQRKDDRESRRFQRTHAFVEREREEPKKTVATETTATLPKMRDPSRPMSDTLAARTSGLGDAGSTAEPSDLTFKTRGDMDASLPADVATATRDEEAADAQLTESLDSQLADLDASDEIRAMEREARADVAANVDAVNAAQTARQDPMDAADISDLDARTRFAGPVEQMTRKELRQRYREMRPEFRQMSKGVTGATEQELKDAAEGMGAIKAEIKERRDLQRQARRVSRGRGQFSDAINNAVAKAMPSEDEAAAEDKRAEGAQQALDAAEKLGAAEFEDRGVGAPPTKINTPPAGSDRLVVPEDAITNLPEMPDDIAAAEDARLAALDDEIAPEVEVDPDTGDPLPEPEAEDEMAAEAPYPSLDTDMREALSLGARYGNKFTHLIDDDGTINEAVAMELANSAGLDPSTLANLRQLTPEQLKRAVARERYRESRERVADTPMSSQLKNMAAALQRGDITEEQFREAMAKM